MKPQPDNSSALSTRCQFHTSSGRQCRLFASDQRSRLCSYHLAAEQQTETANVYAPLIRNSQGLQTAQGINYSLSNLYELLAKNHLSPRRAAVLAYINSLLLRTLPAIDADDEAGITDPTKPKPMAIPVPDRVIDSGADSELDPAPEPPATSSTPPHKPGVSHSANTWDSSISEPDPSKKSS